MISNFNKILLIFIPFITSNLFANNLKIEGLTKLSVDDLQTQTSINLSKDFYNE